MTRPPHPIPDKDTWRKLMRPALQIVRSLEDNGYGKLDFRLGGGTVLMFRFDHRISKDIDIFTHDAQAIGYLSPRLNALASQIAPDYEEQSNAVKLQLRDGSIDFIVAGPVIRGSATETMEVDGVAVPLDSTAEILAKKLLYRADTFKARDVFDMAVALDLDRSSAVAALQAAASTRPALNRRLATMAAAEQDDLLIGIVLTRAGARHVPGMVSKLQQAAAEVDRPPPAPRRTTAPRCPGGMET